MNAHQHSHLDRETAEMLLLGRAASPLADTGQVAGILAAASAPARDHELAGEARAIAAFRMAQLRPVGRTRRPSIGVTKLLAVKAVLTLAGLTGGGVALAAATGHLHPSGGDGTSAAGLLGASATTVAAPSHAGTPASHPSASPSPSLRGLCRAYTARVGNNPGKALDNPAFSALIGAAGGRDNVAAYCTSLLASKPGNGHTSHGHGQQLGKSADHPTGKPTFKPTGKPASHP